MSCCGRSIVEIKVGKSLPFLRTESCHESSWMYVAKSHYEPYHLRRFPEFHPGTNEAHLWLVGMPLRLLTASNQTPRSNQQQTQITFTIPHHPAKPQPPTIMHHYYDSANFKFQKVYFRTCSLLAHELSYLLAVACTSLKKVDSGVVVIVVTSSFSLSLQNFIFLALFPSTSDGLYHRRLNHGTRPKKQGRQQPC